MPITTDFNMRRMQIRLSGITDPAKISPILGRLGVLIRAEAIIQARRQGIVDTGELIRSINHRVNGLELTVGVDAPYASVQEFGAIRTPQSRKAMFARLRETGRLGAKSAKFSPGRHEARPFLIPAFQKVARNAIDLIREQLRS